MKEKTKTKVFHRRGSTKEMKEGNERKHIKRRMMMMRYWPFKIAISTIITLRSNCSCVEAARISISCLDKCKTWKEGSLKSDRMNRLMICGKKREFWHDWWLLVAVRERAERLIMEQACQMPWREREHHTPTRERERERERWSCLPMLIQ